MNNYVKLLRPLNFRYSLLVLCTWVCIACNPTENKETSSRLQEPLFTQSQVDSICQNKIRDLQEKHRKVRLRYWGTVRQLLGKEYFKSENKPPNYKERSKVQMFRDLNFDQGEWRMVFFAEPHVLQPFLKYEATLTKEEAKQKILNSPLKDYFKEELKTRTYPFLELRDKSIMKQMQKDFVFEYQQGMIGTPQFRLDVFQNGKLKYSTSVILGTKEAFQGRDGYCKTPSNGLITDYLAKFKEIDYDPLYFLTGAPTFSN
ncbi:hypothetical protein BKI52_16475 [marine bacterium AO1-C]|nr:hypothetical protein BKI52_16475 [marine bacterium AO1-C]